jgi:hypothetical protein
LNTLYQILLINTNTQQQTMPAKKTTKKRTNLSRNSGAVTAVPSVSAATSGGGPSRAPASASAANRSSKPKTKSASRKPRNEETRPLDDDVDDNVSDVSEDPIDNYQYDPEADEEGEIDDEPRFKYSTAELADSSRNTTCCLVTMCILCIIVAIAVSIIMVKIPAKKAEENANSTPAPVPPMPTSDSATSTAGADSFTSSKESVNLNCNTAGGTCSQTCIDFNCCDPMMNEMASCFFGNRQGCLNYARCHIESSGIEKPSDNINAVCSGFAVDNNPAECENVCNSVKCCYESDSSCKDNNFYTCIDYVMCQNLRDDLQVPHPIDTLETLCSDALVGSLSQGDKCGVACEPAECCWDTSSNNCLQSNFFTCLLYEPCGKLDIPPAYTVVMEPNVDTSLVCSSSYRAINGPAQCESACNSASCCNAQDATNCFTRDPLGCIKYDGCKLLQVN